MGSNTGIVDRARGLSMHLLKQFTAFIILVTLLLEGAIARKSGHGRFKVSCGSHRASRCSLCPLGKDGTRHGHTWCNGDCHWSRGRCQARIDYGGQGAYSPNFYMMPDNVGSMGVFK
eukprot:TRINITY_DN16988_c0_g1_i2.p1 TRINITY_DN16988_c0_g1~~TRINITY_DN16988_c0_g1_i2.p1  ORF type:complete len:126 (-),score=8.23 TRINITY_DN16988_c0_g1_i2:83-433(-)